jgi:hypothetical protein
MRWLFIDPSNETEIMYKKRTIHDIDQFWNEFAKNADRLSREWAAKNREAAIDWFCANIKRVHEELSWECAKVENSELCLVITPESDHHLRPIVNTMLERAPQISGWRFDSYRSNHPLSQIGPLDRIGDSRITGDWSDLRFNANTSQMNVVDLALFSDRFTGEGLGQGFSLCELLLGEELLEKWVGVIDAHRLKPTLMQKVTNLFTKEKHSASDGSLPFEQVDKQVRELRDGIISSLPEQPYYKIDLGEEILMCIKPKPNTELPSRITFRTTLPNLIDAINHRSLFHSERFSRFDERFCYLRILGDVPITADTELRSDLTKNINDVLRKQEAGCCIGGGGGNESAYIDLILTNVETSVEILREFAAEHDLPKTSWLLFHESDLCAEWIGLHSDSPVPTLDGKW